MKQRDILQLAVCLLITDAAAAIPEAVGRPTVIMTHGGTPSGDR